jgi:hypothetical protein
MSEETLRRRNDLGEGPPRVRIGRFWSYSFDELDAWVSGQQAEVKQAAIQQPEAAKMQAETSDIAAQQPKRRRGRPPKSASAAIATP